MKTNDLYQSVTDTIIEILEENQDLEFKRPWVLLGQDGKPARNPLTGTTYRGINQLLLSHVFLKREYPSHTWMTFNQITKQLGGKVLKGSKSVPIVYFKQAFINEHKRYVPTEKVKQMKPQELAAKGIQPIPILKLYRVFNVAAQTEGLDPSFYEFEPQEPLQEFEKDDRVEEILKLSGAKLNIIPSNRAFYNRRTDEITLPLRSQFNSVESWSATSLHELSHWTGHPDRLNREFGKSFGDPEYAKEELVAEISSAFTCTSLGFTSTLKNTASYVQSWIGVLKEDNRAIFRASKLAQEAADYILKNTPYEIPKPDYD